MSDWAFTFPRAPRAVPLPVVERPEEPKMGLEEMIRRIIREELDKANGAD